MIRTRTGTVIKIIKELREITEVEVLVEGASCRAVNYNFMTGPVNTGDSVLLNTTAVQKKLGTGGVHFVMANLNDPVREAGEAGHIMKLRYTPSQVKVLSVEEEESPYAQAVSRVESLDGMPVIIGALHSMIAPAAAALKSANKDLNIAYIMTDGAALPIYFSNLVRELKQKGLIQASITCGNAFGGDLEAINIYTALAAAKAVIKADAVITAMGPGIAGTGTRFGFTGIEQGEIINAVNILEGRPVAIPRVSFADKRERHYGLSHHTCTALGKIALTPATVALPVMDREKTDLVKKQLEESGIAGKHYITDIDGTSGLKMLEEKDIRVTTMGRTVQDDPEFFLAACAAGTFAAGIV